ncbi:MAG: metal-dependent hydrolase [Actinomycetota bacterium]|nr:metal-dependent hydrolase [Actinomycetota bacterium]
MTLPDADTIVSYPAGRLRGDATVLHSQMLDDGRQAVLLDATPCHPVDAGWPDQGPDRAVIRIPGGAGQGGAGQVEWPVLDCVVAATDGAELAVGAAIPVRKGTEGWAFVVAHLLPAEARLADGTAVEVSVDADYRAALNAGHTGCHLASLALNRATAGRWTKETRADALGQPDFDAAAIQSSTITEFGSVDVFRLNKSLRRKGFGADGLVEELPAITEAINATLAGWVAGGAPVRIERDGERLTDRRCWVASLPDGEASIPCGGTHVASLAELEGLTVSFTAEDADGTTVLRMVTRTGIAAGNLPLRVK